MSKQEKILVRFLDHSTPYAKGDVTAVDGDALEKLKKAGVVEEIKNKKASDADGDKDKKADKDKKDGDKDKK